MIIDNAQKQPLFVEVLEQLGRAVTVTRFDMSTPYQSSGDLWRTGRMIRSRDQSSYNGQGICLFW